jgi:hypothetical protein
MLPIVWHPMVDAARPMARPTALPVELPPGSTPSKTDLVCPPRGDQPFGTKPYMLFNTDMLDFPRTERISLGREASQTILMTPCASKVSMRGALAGVIEPAAES